MTQAQHLAVAWVQGHCTNITQKSGHFGSLSLTWLSQLGLLRHPVSQHTEVCMLIFAKLEGINMLFSNLLSYIHHTLQTLQLHKHIWRISKMGNKTFRSHLKLHGDSLTHLTCKIFGIKPLMEATMGFEIRQWRSLALYHLESD
jgi:hypothetical protein